MTSSTERAILAGGCFWGMQDLIRKMPGVLSTRVGYSGGDVLNATYRNHGTHAEAIEIVVDPSVVSYRTLLEFFFQIHDPTTRNRQGNDTGTSYRSGIYYTSAEQKRAAEDTIADVEASGLWPGKVVTEVALAGPFLGSRARTPRLPGKISRRVHLPFRPPELETSASGGSSQGKLGRIFVLMQFLQKGMWSVPRYFVHAQRRIVRRNSQRPSLPDHVRFSNRPTSLATNDPGVRQASLTAPVCTPAIAARRPISSDSRAVLDIRVVKSSILERNVLRIGEVFAL